MKTRMKYKPGYFGEFGGQFVPETLMPSLLELEQAYKKFQKNKSAQEELKKLLEPPDFAGVFLFCLPGDGIPPGSQHESWKF